MTSHENLVLTLCGSARFELLFHAMNEALTLCGHTVFSLATFPSVKGGRVWYTDEQKKELDAAHFRKIDRSDGIVVLNRCAYIGESTIREVEYAKSKGKRIYVLESWGKGYGISEMHLPSAREAAKKAGVPEKYRSPLDFSKERWTWDELLGPAGAPRQHAIRVVQATNGVI